MNMRQLKRRQVRLMNRMWKVVVRRGDGIVICQERQWTPYRIHRATIRIPAGTFGLNDSVGIEMREYR